MGITNTFFNKIQNPLEKQSCVHQLVRLQGQAILKWTDPKGAKGGVLLKIKAIQSLSGQSCLFQSLSSKTFLPWTGWGTLQFELEDKKIMAQVHVRALTSDHIELQFSKDLYWVQRREHFRMKIPQGYPIFLQSFDPIMGAKWPLSDLSLGGCALVLSASEKTVVDLQENQIFTAQLYLGYNEQIELQCQVKRIYPWPPSPTLEVRSGLDQKSSWLRMGLEFLNISQEQQSQIMAVVMDLYRRYY